MYIFFSSQYSIYKLTCNQSVHYVFIIRVIRSSVHYPSIHCTLCSLLFTQSVSAKTHNTTNEKF